MVAHPPPLVPADVTHRSPDAAVDPACTRPITLPHRVAPVERRFGTFVTFCPGGCPSPHGSGSVVGVAAPDDLRPLLDAAREGDDHAVRELVRRTQPLVWRLCRALGSAGEVDDLVQETYLRALRSLPSYRGDAPVRSWLLSIGRHVCADHVRRRTRQRRLVERITRSASVPSGEVAGGADADALHEFVEALGDDRREAFVLTQIVGLSYEEAADVVGCPIGTIRSRVARARLDLVDALRRADAV